MKGKLINLAVILCSLLAAPIIALHHVRLYPVYSKSHVVSLSGIRVNFANSSFGALGFLNWPEQEDYQQIDGVFGLSKLHFPDESFKEPLRSSALSERAPDNPVKSTLRKYQLPPFITIALPPLLDPTTQKYMVDCREAFEPFEIHTENSAYVVESRHFIIRHDQNDMQCELALRRRQSDFAEPVVLGIPFFHQYCVTLEPRHAQISFAPII